ncbi:Prohead protease [uncultured Caudovirales phage]|uniref:Prohead protease n=1 Tax=uncultured Caudovirales phage TaxID=2100421 RepID=A0A6J5RMD7_9CAUD|nr:Prohead protease [uncultured Caudovirales phage]CAB4180112.1 Prohead protease [uncultured Caudovirales phage]CAB4180977.1 Prohead protease [uncultured Caudovirales phage]CAB4194821.1 Prohead protease [uncultured Caudovirales phage]CAB4222929.1 Prohead protease [uncultured Caudovirales phage]
MKLTIPMAITAADSEARTISGRIVAFNEPANASTGKVIFAKNSIQPKNVFLNLEHDSTRRIGKTLSMTMDGDRAINASFKISKTTAGTDAIAEAMDGLRDGFSIELAVDNYEMLKDGTMKVTAGELTGVALVTEPAVRSARVSEVAASEDQNSEPGASETENPTENEGEKVSDNTVTDAPAETVEAAQAPIIQANTNTPVFTSRLRSPITTPESYLAHSIKAMRGDLDSRDFVHAANSTSDNPGLIPTRQLTEVVNGLADNVRASIDSISTGTLPNAGMIFQIPRITVLPDVSQIDELDTITPVNMESEFIDVYVKSFKGSQVMSVELADRSDPIFLQEALRNLTSQYARATNIYNSGVITTDATVGSPDYADPVSPVDILKWISDGAVAIYGATHRFADAVVMSPENWGNVMSMSVDGRPIYNALQPQNAAGNAQPRSLRGSINGIDLWVDTALSGVDSGSMYVINRDSYTWYESPTLQLRTNYLEDGSIGILLYGFGATATKIAAGAYKFTASA